MKPRTIYYLFQILTTLGIMCTVTTYVPFLFSIGFSISDVALINVAFWAIVVCFEIPTGIFADVKGRARSLKIGIACHMIGELLYFRAHGFASALIAEVMAGIGLAFVSGAQQAWIADALLNHNETHERRRVFATASALRGCSAIVGGFLGNALGAYGLRLPWILNATALFAALLLIIFTMKEQGEPALRVNKSAVFAKSISMLRTTSALWWAAACATVFGLVVPFNHYWSPLFAARIGQNHLGWVWVPMYVALAGAGYLIRHFKMSNEHEGDWIGCALLGTGIGFAFLGVAPGIVLPIALVMLHEFGRGAFEPLLESFTQHHIESDYRATYGSLQAFIGRSGCALTLIAVWWGTRGKPNTVAMMSHVLLVCGVLLAFLAAILWLLRPRRS